jgi:hypothetical protein
MIGIGLRMSRFLFYNFSEAPTISDQRKFSSRSSGEIIFLGTFFFLAEIYFGIFFLCNKFISEPIS